MIHTLLTAALTVLVHDAPSGWTYDSGCCGGQDCRPVAESSVHELPTAWQILATGELISKREVKYSRDGDFHRCSVQGLDNGRTLCLYVPIRGS